MTRVLIYAGLALLLGGATLACIWGIARIRTKLAAQRSGVYGDLNADQERRIVSMLNTADAIFETMQNSTIGNLTDFTLLSTMHRDQVAAWRKALTTLKEKHLK
jgi:hypothetical protein